MPEAKEVTTQTGLKLKLAGKDGNAFAILAQATKALRANGMSDRGDEFLAQAQSGDYDHLIQTCMAWFEVE